MEKLYFFVMQSDIWTNNDPLGYLHGYFVAEGGFKSAFLIGLVVAIIGVAFFYGWIANTSPRLSKMSTWLITLVAVGGITFATTQMIVIGSDNSQNQTGMFASISNQQNDHLSQQDLSEEEIANINQYTRTLQNQVSTLSNSITMGTDLGTTAYALLIFFVLSICVKNLTRYGISIPF